MQVVDSRVTVGVRRRRECFLVETWESSLEEVRFQLGIKDLEEEVEEWESW